MKDATLSDLLRKDNINTKNQLIALSDSSWQYFQTLSELQEHTLSFIGVVKLAMAHML